MSGPAGGGLGITVVLHPEGAARVRDAVGALSGVRLCCPDLPAEVPDAVAAAGVLVTPRPAWRDEYLVSGLRWVQSQSAGVDGFPIDEFRRRGVAFSTGAGLHPVVAEHAIGLLLVLLRDLHDAVADMPGRRWRPHVADELGGRTVAIAGLGPIGEGVARRLAGWDTRLIGLTRTPQRYQGELADVRPLGALRDACAEASVLVVAVPGTPETRHLVGAAELDALGPGWLVNVARGPVVDEAGLIARLADGRLRGAGLDVTTVEPPPVLSPLWELPNVVLSPHRAGLSAAYGPRFARLLAANLAAFRGTGPWHNRVC